MGGDGIYGKIPQGNCIKTDQDRAALWGLRRSCFVFSFPFPDIAWLGFVGRPPEKQRRKRFSIKRIEGPEKTFSGKRRRCQGGQKDEETSGQKAPEAETTRHEEQKDPVTADSLGESGARERKGSKHGGGGIEHDFQRYPVQVDCHIAENQAANNGERAGISAWAVRGGILEQVQ